jgi:hypothetical protein
MQRLYPPLEGFESIVRGGLTAIFSVASPAGRFLAFASWTVEEHSQLFVDVVDGVDWRLVKRHRLQGRYWVVAVGDDGGLLVWRRDGADPPMVLAPDGRLRWTIPVPEDVEWARLTLSSTTGVAMFGNTSGELWLTQWPWSEAPRLLYQASAWGCWISPDGELAALVLPGHLVELWGLAGADGGSLVVRGRFPLKWAPADLFFEKTRRRLIVVGQADFQVIEW